MNDIGSYEIGTVRTEQLDKGLQTELLRDANKILAIRDLSNLRPGEADNFRRSWKTEEGHLIIGTSTAEARGLPFASERSFGITREYKSEFGLTQDVMQFSVAEGGSITNVLAFTEQSGVQDMYTKKRLPRTIHTELGQQTLAWISGSLDTVLHYVQAQINI